MAPLGALSQAWVSAEASLPPGWQIRGLWRFDDLWVALSEGPTFDDYLSGSGVLVLIVAVLLVVTVSGLMIMDTGPADVIRG